MLEIEHEGEIYAIEASWDDACLDDEFHVTLFGLDIVVFEGANGEKTYKYNYKMV